MVGWCTRTGSRSRHGSAQFHAASISITCAATGRASTLSILRRSRSAKTSCAALERQPCTPEKPIAYTAMNSRPKTSTFVPKRTGTRTAAVVSATCSERSRTGGDDESERARTRSAHPSQPRQPVVASRRGPPAHDQKSQPHQQDATEYLRQRQRPPNETEHRRRQPKGQPAHAQDQ